jgi:hypothetical protein
MSTKIVYFKNKNDGLLYAAVFKTNIIGRVSDFRMCCQEHVYENGEYLHDARIIVPLEIIGYSQYPKIVRLIGRIILKWQKLKRLLRNRLLHQQ